MTSFVALEHNYLRLLTCVLLHPSRNGPPKVLSTVKKRNSRAGIPSDLEIFTAISSTKYAPEPCKTCGRPDQPERFHSHPKGSQVKIKDIPTVTTKPTKSAPVPKSVQKPVALNFRSDRSKNRPETDPCEMKSNRPSTTTKRGPRTITCYVCGREFGNASFPIHEPKCMEVNTFNYINTDYHYI